MTPPPPNTVQLRCGCLIPFGFYGIFLLFSNSCIVSDRETVEMWLWFCFFFFLVLG